MKTRRMTREQPTEEDMEAAEALILLSKGQPPNPPLPTLILSANLYEDRCSLVGCSLSVQRPLRFCSRTHRNMAEKMAAQDVPIACIGGFQSRSELDRGCGCILINKANQVQTGVPHLELPDFFLTKPSELEFVKKGPASSSWIFFHSAPPPYQQGVRWIPEAYSREFQIGSSSIVTRDLRLPGPTETSSSSSSWSLSLFQHAGESLYCLSHVSGMIPQPKKNTVAAAAAESSRGNTSYVNLVGDEVTHGTEPISRKKKKKLKLKREDGKWIINKETVSVSDTRPLLKNHNPSETSGAAINPPASLNENTDVVEAAEDQTLVGNRDPNTQKRSSSVHT